MLYRTNRIERASLVSQISPSFSMPEVGGRPHLLSSPSAPLPSPAARHRHLPASIASPCLDVLDIRMVQGNARIQ